MKKDFIYRFEWKDTVYYVFEDIPRNDYVKVWTKLLGTALFDKKKLQHLISSGEADFVTDED